MLEKLIAISISARDIGIPVVSANDSTFKAIVGMVYVIIAAASLFYIVLGAVIFVTSAGDPSRTKSARQTILFASIGLAGSTMVFGIVSFIMGSI